jgi:hypothetical protein
LAEPIQRRLYVTTLYDINQETTALVNLRVLKLNSFYSSFNLNIKRCKSIHN